MHHTPDKHGHRLESRPPSFQGLLVPNDIDVPLATSGSDFIMSRNDRDGTVNAGQREKACAP